MGITISDNGSLTALRARVAAVRAALPDVMRTTAESIGEGVVTSLSSAAPQGKGSEGVPPAGDAPGKLSESFSSQVEAAGGGVSVQVVTNQPQKLKWVVEGRGDVYPVNKKALMWQGLPHPVRHAGPSQPNDFVSPVTSEADITAGGEMTAALDALLATL